MRIIKGDVKYYNDKVTIKYIDLSATKINSNNHQVVTFDHDLKFNDTVYVAPYCDECDGEYLWINYLYHMNKIGIKVVSVMGKNFLPIASLFSNEMIIVEQNIFNTFSSSHTQSEKEVSAYNPKYTRRTRPRKYKNHKPVDILQWVLSRPLYFDIKSRALFDSIKHDYLNKIFILYKTPRYLPVINSMRELLPSDKIILDDNWTNTEKIARHMQGDILTYQILSSLEANNKYIGFAGVSNLFCVAPVNSLFLCDYTTHKNGPILKNLCNRKIYGTGTEFLHHSVNRNQGERRFHPDSEEIEKIKYILFSNKSFFF